MGHVDDLPAGGNEPAALGPGGEAGALYHHHGASVVHGGTGSPAGVQRQRPQLGAIGVGERQVHGGGPLVEGGVPAPGSIDELVGHYEVAGLVVVRQAAGGAGGDDALHPQLLHRPGIRTVRHEVGRMLMVSAVAG